jgi:hypothetical protein
MSNRILLLGLATACMFACNAANEELPDSNQCTSEVRLEAWSSPKANSDGSIDVSGMARAPDGVTVRAIYVANVPVVRTEFNYRAWSVTLTSEQVASLQRDGTSLLEVVAFSSTGCAELSAPLVVRLGDAGTSFE